jgi:hypothetical protein
MHNQKSSHIRHKCRYQQGAEIKNIIMIYDDNLHQHQTEVTEILADPV